MLQTKKYPKESKEFQIMKQYFDIIKKYGSIDSDERQAEYEAQAKAFIEDENPEWRKYKEQLIKSWTEKLQKDREEKMQLMQEMYKSMQTYARMENDEDWKDAVDQSSAIINRYTSSMKDTMESFFSAWFNKLGAEYNAQHRAKIENNN